MNDYEKLREIRNEKFPPVLEFGCELLINKELAIFIRETEKSSEVVYHVLKEGKTLMIDENLSNIKNLGKPVSLNDVLGLINIDKIYPINSCNCMHIKPFDSDNLIEIDLSKEIKDQDNETLKEIYNLIK